MEGQRVYSGGMPWWQVLALLIVAVVLTAFSVSWVQDYQQNKDRLRSVSGIKSQLQDKLSTVSSNYEETVAQYKAKIGELESRNKSLKAEKIQRKELIAEMEMANGVQYRSIGLAKMPEVTWVPTSSSDEYRIPIDDKGSVMLGYRDHPHYAIEPEEGREWVHIQDPANAGRYYGVVYDTHRLWGTIKSPEEPDMTLAKVEIADEEDMISEIEAVSETKYTVDFSEVEDSSDDDIPLIDLSKLDE